MSKLDIIAVWKKADETNPRRTSIEDLPTGGYELSAEDLRFVSGGLMSAELDLCSGPTCGPCGPDC